MLTYAVIAVVVVAVLLFMVWGDDGPVLRNLLLMALVLGLVAAAVGVGQWMSTYGS